MFIAAFVAAEQDPDARAYYLRERAQRKAHNAAVVCVARRRCNIILAMLKTQIRVWRVVGVWWEWLVL